MRPRKAVLVIAPNEYVRDQHALRLDVWGLAAELPSSYGHAEELLQVTTPAAVLCDGVSEQSIRQLAGINPDVPFIVVGNTVEQQLLFVRAASAAVKQLGLSRTGNDFPALLRETISVAVARKRGRKPAIAAPQAQERVA